MAEYPKNTEPMFVSNKIIDGGYLTQKIHCDQFGSHKSKSPFIHIVTKDHDKRVASRKGKRMNSLGVYEGWHVKVNTFVGCE